METEVSFKALYEAAIQQRNKLADEQAISIAVIKQLMAENEKLRAAKT